jgi:hypothetical protein
MTKTLTDEEFSAATARRLVAAHRQAPENSPPSAEQTAMFEMFERERWSHQQRLAFIKTRAEVAANR